MMNLGCRQHFRQLHHGILHRENAACRHGTASIDSHPASKNLRVATHHALDDFTMLAGSQFRQLTPMVLGIAANQFKTVQHISAWKTLH